MRAQTRHEMSMGLVGITSMAATDNHLAGLIQRSIDGEELGSEDTSQLAFFYRSLIRTWENSYYQAKMGLYDEAEYKAVSGAWGDILTENIVVMDLWCRYRHIVSPDFRAQLDADFPLDHCDRL